MKVNIGKYKKNGKARTVQVHIDDYDTWSLDHTLAYIIHPALVKYKEKSGPMGHPCLCEDSSKCIIDENDKCPCSNKWNEIIDKMIWAFNEILTDEVHYTDWKEHEAKMQEGLELFGKYYRALWV